MATIPGVLQAGGWIFAGAAVVFVVIALVFQIIRENKRFEAAVTGKIKSEILAKIHGRPTTTVNMLMLGGLFSLVKAIAYTAMFVNVGVTGANYWGSQLSWIFQMFFATMALAMFVCVRSEWRESMPYGVALVYAMFFVASFFTATNAQQLPFAILGPLIFILLVVFLGLFRVRRDGYAIVAIVLFAVVYAAGYYLPYILSPSWLVSITTLTEMIWFLITDVVVVLWFAFLAITAIECGEASKQMLDDVKQVCPATSSATVAGKMAKFQ